jgi:hypothetical protein
MARIPEPFLRANYRGLNEAESNLLRSYLQDRDAEVVQLETRVLVGPGERLPDTQPTEFIEQWQQSSKLKIDAVVERRDVIELVELKDFGRTSFLGQLLMYRYWYSLERSPDKPVQLWVSTPDLNPSSVQPSRFHNVNIHVQSPDGLRHLEQGEDAQPPF